MPHERAHPLGGPDHSGSLADGQHGDRSGEGTVSQHSPRQCGAQPLADPGVYCLGSCLNYDGALNPVSGLLQFTRIPLYPDVTIAYAGIYCIAKGTKDLDIFIGLYRQATGKETEKNYLLADGQPDTRVAATNLVTPIDESDLAEEEWNFFPFTVPYAVTVKGFYWLALLMLETGGGGVGDFLGTATPRYGKASPRCEWTGRTTLPATVTKGSLAFPASAIYAVSAVASE